MTRVNDAVADALVELSELLAISGGDPFKVRAHEKAARAVREHPVDVDRLDLKGLDAIPSVGSHIAAKIRRLLDTGHIDELEDLRAATPAGLRALLVVPGLGPKRARQVYAELGITSMPELLDALHEQRLRKLRGWGARSEENLARALRQVREAGGRMQLGVALEAAEGLVAALQPVPAVERVCYAGSLRRMCETIGDVDLLAASHDPRAVVDAFTSLPDVTDVLARGTTRAAVVTTRGLHVDLRVVAHDEWGAALQYFTGSKAHNVHLRAIAQRRGLKLSEYGLFDVESGDRLAAETEDQVYERLGLPWIPPTLREEHGEVEAATAGRLPHLVMDADLRGDLHVHTDVSDGLATLDDMVTAAHDRGYAYLAITDHAPLLAMQRMTREKALEQRARIRALPHGRGRPKVLHGSELNIQADGSLDWDDDFLSTFDVLVASVHSHFTMSRDEMTRRLIRAIEHPYVNVIGHPTARSIGHRAAIEFDADAVFDAAARTGTALEINSFPDRLDLNGEMARRAAERGVVFAVSTDSHATRHLANIRYGVATAQRGWIEPHQVINTWPLAKLRRFLDKGRVRSARRTAS